MHDFSGVAGGRTSLFAAIVFFLIAVRSATALDPETRITQYRHTVWRVQEGAFQSASNVIAQTPDGYIWIGTMSGLIKYDGLRFMPWTPPAASSPQLDAVYALRSASDGTLWIGTATRLWSWKDGRLQEHLRGRINAIVEDRHHRIWAARSRPPDLKGGLCQVVGDHVGCVGGDSRMRLPFAVSLTEDTHGALWIGTSNQLMRWQAGSFKSYFNDELQRFQGLPSVEGTAGQDDGSVWAAIPRQGFGLLHFVDGVPRKVASAELNAARMTALFVDRDRSLWVGTSDDGLYRMSGERVEHFRGQDGLSSNAVNGFFEDRDGNLWVATSKGLDCFRNGRVVTFSTGEGLSADVVASVAASPDGTVWIGNRGTLDRWQGGHVSSIRVPGNRVTSLWVDHGNRLWMGVDDELTTYEHGQFQTLKRPDGSPLGTAIAITDDRDENVWVSVIGAVSKVLRIRDGQVQEEFTADRIPSARVLAADPAGGIWLGLINGDLAHYRSGKLEVFQTHQGDRSLIGLTIDPDGSAWVAMTAGLLRWKNREMKMLTSRNGLPCDAMFSTIRDVRGMLWIYARCGLIGIADSELQRWWQHPDATIQFELLDRFDGVVPGPSTFQPAVAKSPDGRLWFVNDTDLQGFDPGRLHRDRTPPPVYIEEFQADRKTYATGQLVHLPARSRDIEIGYTALNFPIPERSNFRYKLEGRDQDWNDAGARRQAFYSDLPPGQYRFRVTASNDDGVWNETGASIDFSVAPAYYQTMGFRLALVAAVLLLIAAVHQWRLRQVAWQFNTRQEERVNERTRIARDLHDTLLQTFQGVVLRFQAASLLLPDRPGDARQTLDTALDEAGQAITEARDAVQGLRGPATATSLLPALVRQMGEDLAASHQRPRVPGFCVKIEGTVRPLVPAVRDEVSRIVREALRNAFKHADARAIEVEIRYDRKQLRVRVRDDGRGIPADVVKGGGRAGHYGLDGMRERAELLKGMLAVWSQLTAGTEIELTIPGTIAYRSHPPERVASA